MYDETGEDCCSRPIRNLNRTVCIPQAGNGKKEKKGNRPPKISRNYENCGSLGMPLLGLYRLGEIEPNEGIRLLIGE
jgi:hypothetical protein